MAKRRKGRRNPGRRKNGAESVAENQQRFLEAFAECGMVRKALRRAGMKSKSNTHYKWLREDENYKAAFEALDEEVCGILVDEAMRRAVEGVRKPVFYKGELIKTVREYSDGLLQFLLRARRPDTYRERVDMTVREVEQLDREISEHLETLARRGAAALSGPAEDGRGANGNGNGHHANGF